MNKIVLHYLLFLTEIKRKISFLRNKYLFYFFILAKVLNNNIIFE